MPMKENVSEAVRELTEKPLFSTSAERFLILNHIKSFDSELPQPLRFSKFLSALLQEVSVPIKPHDLIAGRCPDRELSAEEEIMFQAFLHSSDNPDKFVFLSSGHRTYSWNMVVTQGLSGLKSFVKKKLSQCEDKEQRIFLSAVSEIYEAIENYICRYAQAAKDCGLSALADNLLEITDRPQHFTSALQWLWIITLIDCAYITHNPTLTLGRLDQILLSFYQNDLKDGVLTQSQAADYITDYYCKHNLIMGRGEHQVGDSSNSTTFERILNFDAPQYLLLAGTDVNGNPAVNELTQLFAECIVPAFKNPVVVVRYFPGMDRLFPSLWKTITEKALDSASLMIYNDARVIATYERIGLPTADARRYEHFGCNWPSPGDESEWIQGGPKSSKYRTYTSKEEKAELEIPYLRTNTSHSWPEDFMIVLRTLSERGYATIEDFYTLFFERMSDFVDRKLNWCSHELTVRRRHPSAVLTFGDCFLESSLRSATCISAGAKYHFEIQSFNMFGTVADCFIAVDQLVMREKKLTLKELIEATDADFVGYERVLALCRHAEKYGMDTPLSNAHVKRLSETASNLVIEKSKPYFTKEGLFLAPCMQSDTWHLKLGGTFGATPDGRRANTPFSQNLRPSNGSCVNGLTAMFHSMNAIPFDGLLSGALNLDIDRYEFNTPDKKAMFAAILGTYFNEGGMQVQVSVSTVDDLLDAQVHPERHRDLRVRVTGYSGIFVDINRRLQDDIISRFQ